MKIKIFFYSCLILLLTLPASGRESITVLSDDNYPPYIFRDSYGKIQGIIVDQWELWSRKTGIDVELKAMDWSKALTLMNHGGADVIDTLFYNAERALIYDYGKPYADIDVNIYFEKNLSGITDIKSLKGFLVGVKEGDASIDVLIKNGINALVGYPSYEAIILDAAAGGIRVFCIDGPPALYFIHKNNLQDRFSYSFTISSGQFHRAVLKGNSTMLNLVEKGFADISKSEYEAINRKWLGSSIAHGPMLRYFLYGFYIFTAIIIVMILAGIYLKKKIKEKTSELNKAVVELSHSQAKTSALLKANPDMMFIFNEEGVFLDYKAEDNSVLYISPENFLGKKAEDVLPDKIYKLTMEKIRSVKESGRIEFYEYSMEINGITCYFDARMVPFNENKYLVIVRNITEKKKMEEDALKSHKLESLGIFAGGIAHDFNNILAAINGNIALARLKIDDKETAVPLLQQAEKASIRAGRLTGQLLAFAKGGDPVKEFASIIDIAVESADFVMSGSNSIIEYRFEDNLPKIEIDKGQISQVIQNIIINGCQAMPQGGRIFLSIERIRLNQAREKLISGKDYVKISIRDEGVGIEKENLKKIFDPYYTGRDNGNGLGLTICHTIMKRHGGSIEVESEPGSGTTFYLYLPVSDKIIIPRGENMGNTSGKDLSGKSVLIIDDEDQIREIMAEIFKMEGIEPLLASEGSEGIKLFDEQTASGKPVDCIVADLTIPGGMGGKEAVELLRSRGGNFKAIVTSGYSSDPVISRYREFGFDAYITKPFSIHDLLALIREIL